MRGWQACLPERHGIVHRSRTPSTEAVDLEPDRKREILAREALLGARRLDRPRAEAGRERRGGEAAYFEASRVFHPDRYFGKNLGSFRARLERIFQRLSEAHETLDRVAAPRSAATCGRLDPRRTRPSQHGSAAPGRPARRGAPRPAGPPPVPRAGTPARAPSSRRRSARAERAGEGPAPARSRPRRSAATRGRTAVGAGGGGQAAAARAGAPTTR